MRNTVLRLPENESAITELRYLADDAKRVHTDDALKERIRHLETIETRGWGLPEIKNALGELRFVAKETT
jgi:hypothetical protein